MSLLQRLSTITRRCTRAHREELSVFNTLNVNASLVFFFIIALGTSLCAKKDEWSVVYVARARWEIEKIKE